MTNIRFSIDDGEKVGMIGRNGIGKSTLFGVLSGADKDYSGEVVFRRGVVVVATQQEHHEVGGITTLQYILGGLPEYAKLSRIIETYPATMGDDMHKINEYTEALQRFDDKGFYRVEEEIERELDNFQLFEVPHRQFSSLSGGQKRLVEIVKIMHSQAHLALIDEPTNHMDYVAKQQFIDWMKQAKEALLVITHDRDVLREVDRIIELKDGTVQSFKGDYDAYLKQNTVSTTAAMTDYELTKRRIANLKTKVIQFRRLKEKARDPDTIKQFKHRELEATKELEQLEAIEKPTFWIDKESVGQLNYRVADNYKKYKARNIRMNIKSDASRSKHVLVSAKDLSLGYGNAPLFKGVNIDLREGEALQLRGRNGAGKTTLIRTLLRDDASKATICSGELHLDSRVRIGVYEQEVSSRYFDLTLYEAIERIYLDKQLSVSDMMIRRLMGDYLFNEGDMGIVVSRLSGGQKARLQLIQMLANDPQLLVLDEPTNHLDLPSIEELETALQRYVGAILYVSHDGYFCQAIGGEIITIEA